MEQDDEEFEQLLGEIPRATSAPPHIEELQRSPGSRLLFNPFQANGDYSSLKHASEVRSDERYKEFCQRYSVANNISSPFRADPFHQDLLSLSPDFSPLKQLPSFYPGLANHEAQYKGRDQLQPVEISPLECDKLNTDYFGNRILAKQSFVDEHSLSTAFGALDINGQGQHIHNNGSSEENADGLIINGIIQQELENGALDGFSYSQKQLHEANGFLGTTAAMQLRPFSQSNSCRFTELHPLSLQQHASYGLDVPVQVQQCFQDVSILQHQNKLQEQHQLHLCGQNQGVHGPNIPYDLVLQKGLQGFPSILELGACQHPLFPKNQAQFECMQDIASFRPWETPVSILDYAPFSQFGDLRNAQGPCGIGTDCPQWHSPPQQVVHLSSCQDSRFSSALPGETRMYGDRKLLQRNSKGTSITNTVVAGFSGTRKKCAAIGHRELANTKDGRIPGSLSIKFSEQVPEDISELQFQLNHQQQFKYTSLKEVEGRIFTIAKDQHGCRFLQRKFDEGDPEEMEKIFLEVIDHIIELMTDPFGNYLVQKLLEVCTDAQHMQILHAVTIKDELVAISLNMHGTRAVQKLIETLKSREHIALVISSLRQGVVTLIKDLNGNHVVQRCLQRLKNEDNEFIFDAAASNCVEIATHRHGCCVLQRCIDFAAGKYHQQLVAEVAANALVLSQDQYGNYVVQYILDLDIPWASMEVMIRLEGNYALLSMQKFSSNVVEKCLRQAGDENRTQIVNELMNNSVLAQLLQDPYANYVVQCALTVTKGALHASLVEAIRPHSPILRSSPFGKRILSRTNLKR